MTNRILELPAVAGSAVETAPPAKPRRTRRAKSKPKPASAPPAANPAVVRWATFGVIFTLLLSAGLNGYANAGHSPVAWAGWLMGLSVPVIVLTLSKVAGEKHRGGNRPAAWLAGGSGAALLFLSVYHCSQSIALLTGSGLVLAVPMAVAIDVGLVACEVALVTEAR